MKGKKPGRLVSGVGLNDADYSVNPRIKVNGKWIMDKENICPYYTVWSEMLKRGYSNRLKTLKETYRHCTVCEEWLIFSNFKAWMESQDWQGKALDKDLLVENNKYYCPDNCVFIYRSLNSFLTLRNALRGNFLLGVNQDRHTGRFRAEGSKAYLGTFTYELDAHIKYLEHKLDKLQNYINIETDKRVLSGLLRIEAKIKHHIINKLPLTSL